MTAQETNPKGRGWNFRKGAKDAPTTEELRERGRVGGKAQVPKGFCSKEVVAKALETRRAKKQIH